MPPLSDLQRRRRVLDERFEDGLQLEGRAADRLEDFRRRRLLVEGFSRLVEETYVVDGDGGLARESLHERDLIRWEQARFVPRQHDRSVCTAFAHQRYDQHRAATETPHVFRRVGKFRIEQRRDIGE